MSFSYSVQVASLQSKAPSQLAMSVSESADAVAVVAYVAAKFKFGLVRGRVRQRAEHTCANIRRWNYFIKATTQLPARGRN